MVRSLKFPHLSRYFKASTLQTAEVVLPSSRASSASSTVGFTYVSTDFEQRDFGGVTYWDTFFIKKNRSGDEAVTFSRGRSILFNGGSLAIRSFCSGMRMN